jgi:hypothetical protein
MRCGAMRSGDEVVTATARNDFLEAHSVNIWPSTLHRWLHGQSIGTDDKRRLSPPLPASHGPVCGPLMTDSCLLYGSIW